MMQIDDKQVREFEKDMVRFKRQAYPFATKQTVNKAAFETRAQYQGNMRNDLTLRNKWTTQSVRVEQARTLVVSRQEAVVGSLADYMRTQEEGGTVRPTSGKHQPIATGYAAGQNGQRPRTKLPRRPNMRKNIRLNRVRGVQSRKARNAANIAAARKGSKYAYIDTGRRKGIVKVLGKRVRMVWDLSRKSVQVKPTPLLAPAVDTVTPRIPSYYKDALVFQLRRAGVRWY